MSDASLLTSAVGAINVTAEAAIAAYELRQINGKVAVFESAYGATSAQVVTFASQRKAYNLTKATGIVLLAGGRAYWDYSAGNITYKKVGDQDFYAGRVLYDAASADTAVTVEINSDPPYDLDLVRDPYLTAPIGTQALGGFLPPRSDGGALDLVMSSTNEAQKVDALGVDTFSKNANAIIEFAFRVISDGAGTVVDASLGIANDTHATDADSIANHLLMHLDANVTNINFQSKDGTTTVAATDSTTDYTEGSALAQRVEVWFDLRSPADVQVYVNGVNVLPATVFDLSQCANELRLLAHVEKTAAADTYEIAVDWMRARFSKQ